MEITAAKRRRLSPEQRREEIMDAAAALVVSTGIATINMDRIAEQAGVSKGLVYAYFPNVTTLLQAVLMREHRALSHAQLNAIAAAESFEEMASTTAHINHERLNERGLLVKRLRGDPDVNKVMKQIDRKSRRQVLDYLSGEVTRNFEIPVDIARLATELVIGPGSEYQKVSSAKLAEMDAVWGAMMTGAMKELERRYGAKGEGNE